MQYRTFILENAPEMISFGVRNGISSAVAANSLAKLISWREYAPESMPYHVRYGDLDDTSISNLFRPTSDAIRDPNCEFIGKQRVFSSCDFFLRMWDTFTCWNEVVISL